MKKSRKIFTLGITIFLSSIMILTIKSIKADATTNYLTSQTDLYSDNTIDKGILEQQIPLDSMTAPLPNYTEGMSYNEYFRLNNINPLDYDARNWEVPRTLKTKSGVPLILSGKNFKGEEFGTNVPALPAYEYTEGETWKTLLFPSLTSTLSVSESNDIYTSGSRLPDLTGYGEIGSASDYLLTKKNNIILPSRYNLENNDVWLQMKSNNFVVMKNVKANLTVTDRDTGESLAGDPKYFINTNTKFNTTPSGYNNLGFMGKLGLPAVINTANSKGKNVSVKNYSSMIDEGLGAIQNASSEKVVAGGFGGITNLNGFYRSSDLDDDFTATDGKRAQDAKKYTDVNYFLYQNYPTNIYNPKDIDKIPQKSVKNADGTYSNVLLYSTTDAYFSIETSRPYFTDISNSNEQYESSKFDDMLGINSFKIVDDGITSDGTPVGTEINNVRVQVSNQEGEKISDSLTLNELQDFLNREENKGKNVTLTYLYSAKDASEENIGKTPSEIADNTGAYAVPFVRTIKTEDPTPISTITVHYKDLLGNKLAEDVTLTGEVGASYTTEQIPLDGYSFKEVQGNTSGTFTTDPQEVTYFYTKNPIVGGNITVEYWEYTNDGNEVEKIHDDAIISGNVGDRYHAEAYYVKGYGFSGVNTDNGLSPVSGLITEEMQTVKLIYNKLSTPSSNGLVLVQYQDDQGKTIAENELLQGEIDTSYETQQKSIEGYSFVETIGNTKGIYSEIVQVVTYVYSSNNVSEELLVPIWRAYNMNDGDHLYTTSKDEYDWIVGLKWQAEGVAFQSVLSSYKQAIPIYRLYNANSGEHFYTVSQSEYDSVASKGWKKEGTGFYMVPKEKGHPIYRVFNPNATGPGSHLFTKSKTETDWLISLGWKDEGIAFYSPR